MSETSENKYLPTAITTLGIAGSLGGLYYKYGKVGGNAYLPHLAAGIVGTIAMPTLLEKAINPMTRHITSVFTSEEKTTENVVKFVDNVLNTSALCYLAIAGVYTFKSDNSYAQIAQKTLVCGGLANLASQIGNGNFDTIYEDVGIGLAKKFAINGTEELLRYKAYPGVVKGQQYSADLVEGITATLAGTFVSNALKGGDQHTLVKNSISDVINRIAYDSTLVSGGLGKVGVPADFYNDTLTCCAIESLQPYFDNAIFHTIEAGPSIISI